MAQTDMFRLAIFDLDGTLADKFKRVLKQSGVPREQAIAIGDEVRDIEAARSAGIGAGAVTWGYSDADALRAARPRRLFTSMEEIVRALT